MERKYIYSHKHRFIGLITGVLSFVFLIKAEKPDDFALNQFSSIGYILALFMGCIFLIFTFYLILEPLYLNDISVNEEKIQSHFFRKKKKEIFFKDIIYIKKYNNLFTAHSPLT